MSDIISIQNKFSRAVIGIFREAFKLKGNKFKLSMFILKTIHRQRNAAKRRLEWLNQGVNVPALAIFSITGRCNLKCKGCYSHAQGRSHCGEISTETVRDIIGEASELGMSIMLLAGGEPFIRKDIIEILKCFPQIIFPIFTNGLLIDESMAANLAEMYNVVPVISLEGMESETDDRRGEGVYKKIVNRLELLRKHDIFYGVSFTVTTQNISCLTSKEFISKLYENGCRLFFFVQYVPVEEGTVHLALGEEERFKIEEIISDLRKSYRAIFIDFPGDEESYGGCLAAGRGFVHINQQGGLEPCPFAPYSDVNLTRVPLKEALKSEFLEKIRQQHELLSEGVGGCALWENREMVKSLLEKDNSHNG